MMPIGVFLRERTAPSVYGDAPCQCMAGEAGLFPGRERPAPRGAAKPTLTGRF